MKLDRKVVDGAVVVGDLNVVVVGGIVGVLARTSKT